MKAIVVFGLIFVFTMNLSLDSSATHLTGRHRETIHELAPLNKITPPCKAGLLPYQNCKKPTMNGCGSSTTHTKILALLGPYNNLMTSCCNAHDLCFDICAKTNLTQAYTKCNNEFRTCMHSKCYAYAKNITGPAHEPAEHTCKLNADLYWKSSSLLGRPAFSSAQKKVCSCYDPKKGSQPKTLC